jgi:predicted PurR-regulated permease PerM
MSKKTLAKNKITFSIVIVFIFLIALGIILLLFFINQRQQTANQKQTLEQTMIDLLDVKLAQPTKIDPETMIELLNISNTDKDIKINEQEIFNLLNQKN